MKNFFSILLVFFALLTSTAVKAHTLVINYISIGTQQFPNNYGTDFYPYTYNNTGALHIVVNITSNVTTKVQVSGEGSFWKASGLFPTLISGPTTPIKVVNVVANVPVNVDLGDYNYSIGNDNALFYLHIKAENTTYPVVAYANYVIYNTIKPLPVTLTAFTAKAQSNGVALNWSTATELNFEHFVLQSSADGVTYTDVAVIAAGGGNTLQGRKYSFVDSRFLYGITYYRLRIVDFDGTSEYSPVQAIVPFGTASANVLVKFGDHYFSYDLPDELTGYVLTDLTGRVVFKQDNASPLTYQPNDGRVYVLRVLTKSGQTVNHLVQ